MSSKSCISGLNVERDNYRSNAANMIKILKQLIENSSFNESRIQTTVGLLKQVKTNLAHYDDTIHVLLEEDDFIRDMEESSALSADIDKAIKQAECILDKLTDEALKPKFNGEAVEWFRFWESFKNEIHAGDFSPQFKLACLKHRLESWPLHMIAKLGTDDSAYVEALKLLQTTFSNKKVLVESHLYALLDLEPPVATPVSLMRFSSDFDYHIRALKAYKTNVEEAGFLVAAVLNKKLPEEIWDRINKIDRTSYWTFPEFQKALNFEIDLLNFEFTQKSKNRNSVETENDLLNCEFAQKSKIRNSLETENCSSTSVQSKITLVAQNCATTTTTTEDNKACKTEAMEVTGLQDFSNRSQMCHLCSECHHFSGCTVYKTPDEKMKRAKQLTLCLICVEDVHTTEKCSKDTECKFCKGKHSEFLCSSGKLIDDSERTKDKKKRSKKKEKNVSSDSKDSDPNKLKKLECAFCNGNHPFGACPKFNTPYLRSSRADFLKLCHRCIKGSHTTSNCMKKNSCKNCGGGHNTLLCVHPSSKNPQKPTEKQEKTIIQSVNKKPFQVNNQAAAAYLQIGYLKSTVDGNKQLNNICSGSMKFLNKETFLPNGYVKPPIQRISEVANLQIRSLSSSGNALPKQEFPTRTGNLISLNHVSQPGIVNEKEICTLCSGSHHFSACDIYKIPSEKRVRAALLKCCLVCVSNKHTTGECLELKICKYCRGRHHTLLCVDADEIAKAEDKNERRRLKKKEKKDKKVAETNGLDITAHTSNFVKEENSSVSSGVRPNSVTKVENQAEGSVSVRNGILSNFIKEAEKREDKNGWISTGINQIN